ncbi:HAD hydrolase, REG-2-like, family IA [Leptospira fainei serovar Hurstbridge str. BUT 6]|uniref:HAD hydrolase, REG-2-like, family IA n=1 Tax=Leptospira fainei serovar Hurstbridge str. BUT 6 TaxID=1193011 RepID=S3UWC7_9LEPT|nr:HAD-IA family hydrolase [Leptospira fainei]EPG73533.1 HAD hydrolase, REG-2-like, family IA [Leptospira fainei serovar Hurstbridge str. BUT 6]
MQTSLNTDRFLFLDVGDTLLTMKKPAGEIYFDVLKNFGLTNANRPAGSLERAFRKAYSELTKEPLPEHRDKFHAHSGGSEGWWRDLLGIFLKEIGSDLDPDPIFLSIFQKFDDPSVWEIDPGFPDLLSFVKKSGYGLGIISNWDHRLRDLLGSVGVLSYFNPIFVSAEFGFEKPSHRIFQAASETVGLPPEKLIYCGDKVELDITPTRELGWTAFHKNEKGDLQHLGELVGLLKGLSRDKIRES